MNLNFALKQFHFAFFFIQKENSQFSEMRSFWITQKLFLLKIHKNQKKIDDKIKTDVTI
jgi:hypothetical protein